MAITSAPGPNSFFPGEDASHKYPVAEIFGPTIEGEGDLIGAVCHFVRFAGCDSACTWCDSGHAVLVEEVRKAPRLTAREIFQALATLKGQPAWVVFSGGNPVLQPGLEWLIDQLNNLNISVNVETQGTKFRKWLNTVQLVTISPKPPSSGNPLWIEDLAGFINKVNTRKILKVVIFDDEDLDYAAEVHNAFPGIPFFLSSGTRAGGLDGRGIRESLGDTRDRFRSLAERASRDARFGDVRILPQLHVFAWGHELGH